jgi:hypothetical protein
MGKWKGVRHGLEARLELYDLESDIGERTDVAAARPEVVLAMEEFLRECRTDSPEYPSRSRRPEAA